MIVLADLATAALTSVLRLGFALGLLDLAAVLEVLDLAAAVAGCQVELGRTGLGWRCLEPELEDSLLVLERWRFLELLPPERLGLLFDRFDLLGDRCLGLDLLEEH